jgi:hypothetical protein
MKDIPALAFPHKWEATDGTTIIAKGMTLRDYFAAKAMQATVNAWIQNSVYPPTDMDVAENAYAIADAMMEARDL